MRTWIKNPLAVWTGNDASAAGGIVIDDGLISELLADSETPADEVDVEFDALGDFVRWRQASLRRLVLAAPARTAPVP